MSQLSQKLSPRLNFRPVDGDGNRVEVDAKGITVASSDTTVIGDGGAVEVVAEDGTEPGAGGKAGPLYRVVCPGLGAAGTGADLHYTIDVDPGDGVVTIEGTEHVDFIHEFATNAGVTVDGVPR